MGFLFGVKEENYVICRKMDGTGEHDISEASQTHIRKVDLKKDTEVESRAGLFGGGGQ
jgi:hypothetical protein